MPSEREATLAKETLLGYSQKLGDEIVEQNAFEEDEDDIMGFTAADEAYSTYYNVFGAPQFEFFQVIFGFSLSENIINKIDEKKVSELTSGEDHARKIGNKLINSHDETELNWLEYQLKQGIINPQTICEIDTTSDDKINRFSVFSLVFPYEDNFSLSDYYNTTEAVLSTGEKGSDYLHHAVQVSEEEDGEIGLDIRI